MKRYYELLGLSEDSTAADIDKAYKRAASKYHPDKQHGKSADEIEQASKTFVDIKAAYECLSDAERKINYDETGAEGTGGSDDPVEDLFLMMVNELVDRATSFHDMLESCRQAVDDIVSTTEQQEAEKRAEIINHQRIIRAIRYKGKKSDVVTGVFLDKIKNCEEAIQDLIDSRNAAKGVYDLLKDYEATDKPNRRKQKQELIGLSIRDLLEGPKS